jgi:NCS1 family nucleobase:cation symporter-1
MPFGYYFSYFVVVSRCVLAIVWLGLVCPTNHFITSEANCTQCPNHDWRSMHVRLAHSHLAKLCQHPQSHTPQRGHHHIRNVWLCALLPASASLPMHTLHQGMALQQTPSGSWTNTTKVQYFFGFKSVIAPIIFLAVFGDTLRRAGGTISHSTVISQGTTVGGSALAWAFFASK